MIDDNIWQTVTQAMAEEFELLPEQLTHDARIKEDLKMDSLDIVDLVIVLENAFEFRIRDKSKLKKITTMGEIADFISQTIQDEKCCKQSE
jgi:acyl carrier protein